MIKMKTRLILMALLSLFLLGAITWLFIETSPLWRQSFFTYLQARIWFDFSQGDLAPPLAHPTLFWPLSGQDESLADVVKTGAWFKATLFKLFGEYLLSVGLLAGLSWVVFYGVSYYKRLLKKTTLLSVSELNRRLTLKRQASELQLGKAHLIKDSEIEHLLFLGAPRTGKSTGIKQLIRQARHHKQRMVIFDVTGELVDEFFDPKKDVLLNPFDGRSHAWDIREVLKTEDEIATLAAALFPEAHHRSNDPFWQQAACEVFKAAIKTFNQRKEAFSLPDFLGLFENRFEDEGEKTLYKFLKFTSAAHYLSCDRTAAGILSNVNLGMRSLKYLNEQQGKPFFLEDWVAGTQYSGNLFLSSSELQLPNLRPLITLWLDLLAKYLMKLKPDTKRRLWFFLDELTSLHRVPSLQLMMSRAPKYGGCVVVGAQSIAQLDTYFGQYETKALIDCFGTKVIFRQNSPESAQWAASCTGNPFAKGERETHSVTERGWFQQTTTTKTAEQEDAKKARISAEAVMNLPKLQAYLFLPDDLPPAKIKLSLPSV